MCACWRLLRVSEVLTTGFPQPKLGLRERKKQRTRQTILKAAFDLFAKRGYAQTTLEDIAEAAEVSTGTLFAYFRSKEQILFPEQREFYEQLKQQLESRAPEATTFDVLGDLIPTIRPPDETFEVGLKIMREERLHDRQRARYLDVEHLHRQKTHDDLDARSIPARGPEGTSTTDWHGHGAA